MVNWSGIICAQLHIPSFTSCSVWINNIQKHLLFPQGILWTSWMKKKVFNYFAFVLLKIIILLTVKYPPGGRDRPMDFNGGRRKCLFTGVVSDSTLQLTLRNYQLSSFAQYQSRIATIPFKRLLRYLSTFLLPICVRLDFLHLLQPKQQILQQIKGRTNVSSAAFC